MYKQVTLNGKQLRVEIGDEAQRRLSGRGSPLLAEMELYFSCLLRKKVRFVDASAEDGSGAVAVNERLSVSFRPVMTQSCSVDDVEGDEPPVTDFPITNPAAFVPHWLRIDYRDGQWQGEFGYQGR